MTLAGLRAPSIAVAFSPVLYALDPKKQNRTNLGYRQLFAIAAGCDVVVYDTQDFRPVVMMNGEDYQLDYITSLSWNATGSQLCAFGAHFQYEFFDFQGMFEPLALKVTNFDDLQLNYKNSIAAQKAAYVKRVADNLLGKTKSKPAKPEQFTMEEPSLSNPDVKIYSVSELSRHDLQPPILLQITKEEVDYLLQRFYPEAYARKQSSALASPASPTSALGDPILV